MTFMCQRQCSYLWRKLGGREREREREVEQTPLVDEGQQRKEEEMGEEGGEEGHLFTLYLPLLD